ncbi:hypothetical protein DFH08DRAFT_814042 [Mycena albidolilacea]|uniref:Uncharacterized protein n=1 Tax=Mycena albidolilacea TaxID=1033008 RepID=A0AAD7ELP7_9AGAR|nr:hypothetical protein DFH08DRAFT_814042 [Mycena albidolilacea]
MLASILVMVRARWICKKYIVYLSLYRLPYLRCRFDSTQAATAVASYRLDGGWTAPALPGLWIVITSICRTPVRFRVEPWTAQTIPPASDMFGLVLLILSHPTGTQVRSYRLDSGGTASAARTPVRFGVEPFFLNCTNHRRGFNCVQLLCGFISGASRVPIISHPIRDTGHPFDSGSGHIWYFYVFLFDSLLSKATDDRDLLSPPIPWHAEPQPSGPDVQCLLWTADSPMWCALLPTLETETIGSVQTRAILPLHIIRRRVPAVSSRTIESHSSSNRELSTDDLVALVKRLIAGPETWTSRDSVFTPEVSKKIILHPVVSDDEDVMEHEGKLVCGGRYVLFHKPESLECWDVKAARLVWTYTPKHAKTVTGTKRIAVDLQMHGTVGAVGESAERDRYLILGWKAKSAFLLRPFPGTAADTLSIALIPGHMILEAPSVEGEYRIHLVAHDALLHHFAPVIAPDGSPEFNKVFSDQISKRSTLGDSDFLAGKSVHESPIRDGTYPVWIAGSRGVPNVSFKWTRCCCWLSIMPGQPPQWYQGTVFDLKQHTNGDVTSSGHSLTFVSQQPRLILPMTTSQLGKLDLAGSGFRMLLAPYSGAITYCTPTSIVIQYFN